MRFGSTCELSDKVIKQARSSSFLGASACEVMKSGIVETILDWVRSSTSIGLNRQVKAKQKVDMSKQLRATKTQGRVNGIPKFFRLHLTSQ